MNLNLRSPISGFLFLPIIIAFMSFGTLLASTFPTNQSTMLADWKRAKEYTKEYIDAMPEDAIGYKPAADVRSFAEQMLHIANANYAFASAASGKTNPVQGKNLEKQEFKTKEALSKAVMDSYDFVISSLGSVSDTQMSDKIKLFNMEMEKGTAFHKAFEHQTHHRGQTTLYLRLKGVKPPQEKLF